MLRKKRTTRELSPVRPGVTSEANTFRRETIDCGIIKSVLCRNFVTYDEVELHPTDRLNVIIGPNGSGKSTIIAAIVIGLGGNPKLLSRSPTLQDYIKSGQTTAEIVIELSNGSDQGNTIFYRSFNMNGKTVYKVNDDVISKNAFLKVVDKFRIQINNLCQFLPQDRVQDFTKMNPQDILLNTMSSVCSGNVFDNFTQLCELQQQQVGGKNALDNNKRRMEEIKLQVQELKHVLDRYNAKNDLNEKLKVYKVKLLWLEAGEMDRKLEELLHDMEEAKRISALKTHAFKKAMRQHLSAKKYGERLDEDARKQQSEVTTIDEKRERTSRKTEETKKKIRETKIDLEKRKREMAEQRVDLRNESRILDIIAQDLKNASVAANAATTGEELRQLEGQLNVCRGKIKKHMDRHRDIGITLDDDYNAKVSMLKKSIETMKNIGAEKMRMLQTHFPSVYKGVIWLRDNKHTFRGKIYEPILLELNVVESKYVQYCENAIPRKDLLSFVCEDRRDVAQLIDALCVQQKLTLNVAYSPPAIKCHYKSTVPIESLQRYGFITYMIDIIEGPATILNHLCSLYHLHRVPIGSEEVNKHTDSIPAAIRLYFGGQQRYNASMSRYSQKLSLVQNWIHAKNLISTCDMRELNRLESQLSRLLGEVSMLKNERTALEAKVNEIEFERSEITKKKRTIEANVMRCKELEQQLRRQKVKVERLNANLCSDDDMRTTFTTTVHGCVRELLALHKAMSSTLSTRQTAIAKQHCAMAVSRLYKSQNQDLEDAVNEASEQLKQAQKTMGNIMTRLESLKNERREKIEEMKKLTQNLEPSHKDFPFRAAFAEITEDLSSLMECIEETLARLGCMGDEDREVVAAYERKCQEISDLEHIIETTMRSDVAFMATIRELHGRWMTQISNVVDTINHHFSEFMQSMGYVGEIALTKKDEFDFESYGIQILVQYRHNVPLQALDRYVQSGGERAVAIAAYTLSLQHVTHVPFRCVDEINQGMDVRHERKIFEMLLHETTQADRSQYFFVSPKLLQNLPYNEHVTVHTIFNGKGLRTSKLS